MSQIGAHPGISHNHGDGPDRTNIGTQAVANAFVAVDDDGFTAEHGEDVAFRANVSTCGATDAVVRVNLGMLGARTVGADLSFLRGFMRLFVSLPQLPEMRNQEKENDRSGNGKRNELVYGILRPGSP